MGPPQARRKRANIGQTQLAAGTAAVASDLAKVNQFRWI
jgi:hypothetical protein